MAQKNPNQNRKPVWSPTDFKTTRTHAGPMSLLVTPKLNIISSALIGGLFARRPSSIGGAPGIGKATLAWRLARFLLANP